ncbi:MAG: phosphatidylglycerophosphatase A [Bacteroidota bacterium]|nr:phosphatidylglycerophosphatase A [Ferruginibacter sp.]
MIKIHKLLASVGGIGYIKGGGTIAAVAYCICWFFVPASAMHTHWQVLVPIAILIIGTWSSNVVDAHWGEDSSKVVIDEVAGMAIALLYVPHNIWYLLISLAAFRFFDIVKPLGVRKAESLPKGWGVMADDTLAGIYALVVIHISMVTVHNFN